MNRLLASLLRRALDRPVLTLLIALALTACTGAAAFNLSLDPSYYALLPEDAPYVVEANAVRDRTGGSRDLVLAIRAADPEVRERAAVELVAAARAMPEVRRVDLELPASFFADRALWLMDDRDVDALLPAVRDAIDVVKAQHHPFALHLDPEEEAEERRIATERIETILDRARDGFPRMQLTSADGEYRFVIVTPRVRVMDTAGTHALFEGLDRAIAKVHHDSSVEVRYAGRFATVREQERVLQRDMTITSILSLALCVAIGFIGTRRLTSVALIGVTVAIAMVWMLGVAGLAIGTLNTVTGLLLSVLVGIGIDFPIHITTRYGQLRATGLATRAAVEEAVLETAPPAFTAALTTAGAFLALLVSDLRAFVEFGALAAIGVLLSVIVAYTIVPPALLLLDGRPPKRAPSIERRWRVPSIPRWVPWCVAGFSVLFALAGVRAIGDIRFENEYRLIDSDADRFFAYVDENLGFRFDPTVIVVDSDADLAGARRVIEERRASSDAIDRVVALDDFLPRTNANRTQRIAELRALVDDPMLDRANVEELATARRIAAAEPWTAADLPSAVRERLSTEDGSGRLLLLWSEHRIESDREALAWAAELDALRTDLDAAGIEYLLSTETVMPAWVHRLVVADAPAMFGLSALIVLLLVIAHFRSWRALVAFGTLAAGFLGLLAIMGAFDLELTTFNLIVLPSIVGIGIDSFVFLTHRHAQTGDIAATLRETGVATVLTALTTAAGFGSAIAAQHPGVQSVGPLSLVALACLLVSALVLLPSALTLLPKRRTKEERVDGSSLEARGEPAE